MLPTTVNTLCQAPRRRRRRPRGRNHVAAACGALERFFIALVAVLPGTTIRRLPLTTLDLAAATLTTGSGLMPHVVRSRTSPTSRPPTGSPNGTGAGRPRSNRT
ncbi:hypothetical protein QFZ68_006986 [Streptomyces sp. V1I6]|nr:hypothetical protein [Streptomyces sp. V1I6]